MTLCTFTVNLYPCLDTKDEQNTLQYCQGGYRVQDDHGDVSILTDVDVDVVLDQFLLEESLHEGEVIRQGAPSEEVRQGDGDETDEDDGGAQDGDEAGGEQDRLLALHHSTVLTE